LLRNNQHIQAQCSGRSVESLVGGPKGSVRADMEMDLGNAVAYPLCRWVWKKTIFSLLSCIPKIRMRQRVAPGVGENTAPGKERNEPRMEAALTAIGKSKMKTRAGLACHQIYRFAFGSLRDSAGATQAPE
jgi:hypothetical protein